MRRLGDRFWLSLAGLGFGLMLLTYGAAIRVATPSPWTGATMAVQEDRDSPLPPLAGTWPLTLRFLEPRQETFGLPLPPDAQRSLAEGRAPKLIQVPEFATIFTPEMLASGRLPKPGAGEVLAGPDVEAGEQLTVDNHVLTVVGRLRPLRLPFSQGYLMPESPANASLFPADAKEVHAALVFSKGARTQWNETEREDVHTRLAQGEWTQLSGQDRVPGGWYALYLLGLFLLLTGGSVALMRRYWIWAWRGAWGWLGPALQQTVQHRRLLVGLHAAYFGLCLIGMVVIYQLPQVQDFLLASIRQAFAPDSGVLSVAASAYRSHNILRAAMTTVAINFLAGSLLVITLPSVIVPGSGGLLALVRAVTWGLLLAPTSTVLAGAMIPHSLCLFLEGEGYILAAFYGLIVPLTLLRTRGRKSIWARWREALVINLQGNFLVLIVLTVAALYEATEVIAQMWF